MHELPPPPDPAVVERVSAVVIAGHQGDRALVEAALNDERGPVRESALSALVRIDARRARDRVTEAFTDPATGVRARAAELAATIDVDPQQLLTDPDARVTEVACFACGEIDWDALGTEPPIAALSQIATSHDDAMCRESAAAALGAIGDERGLDAVLHACGDRVTVRRRATLALAAFDDPRADAALETALDDKDWQVRQAAEDLLEVGRVLDGEPDPDAYAD